MKKLFISLLSMFMLFTGVAFASCGENNESYSIVLESTAFDEQKENYIAIDITDMNEGESYDVSIKATIPNQDNGIVEVNSNYNEVVEANSVYNANLNYNTITIKPVSEGTAELIVSARKAPSQKIIVYVYSNMTNLTQTRDDNSEKKTQYIEFDTDTVLDSDRFLNIEARDTCNQKDIVWSLLNTYGGSLTINGDIIRLDSARFNQFQLTQPETISSIVIRATSKYNPDVYTDVSLDVITGMSLNSFKFNNNIIDAKEDVGERVELVITTNANDERREIYFYVELQSAYNLSMVRLDDETLKEMFGIPIETLDITQDNFQRDGDIHSFRIKVISKIGAKVGLYDLAFTFTYNNYDYRFTTKTFKVNLIQVVNKIEVTADSGTVICDSRSNKYGTDNYGEIDIYNQYQNGKGQAFNVDLSPESAYNKNFFLRLRVEKDLANNVGFNLNNYVQMNTENGLPIEFDKEFDTGDYVFYKSTFNYADGSRFYMISKTSVENASFAVGFYSETDSTINCFTKLKLQYAPSDNFDISGDLEKNIETKTNDQETIQLISNDLISIKVDSLYLEYEESDDYTIGILNKDGNQISFTVAVNSLNFDGEVDIALKHKNGYKANQAIKVNFFRALTSASVTLQNATAGNIANSELEEQEFPAGAGASTSLSELVVTFGSTVSLNISHDANESIKSIDRYYFIVGKGEGDKEVKNYDSLAEFFEAFVEKDLLQSPNYFTYRDIDNTLTFNTVENAFIGYVVFDFCGYDADYEEVHLFRIIKVESYVPVQTLSTRDILIERIAEDSLSYGDATNLSSKNVSVYFRKDNNAISYYSVDFAPSNSEHYIELYSVLASADGYEFVWFNENGVGLAEEKGLKYNDEWIYKIEDVSSTGKNLTFKFIAKTTLNQVEFIDTLVVEYHSYSSIPFRLAIDISIKNSDRVESVVWENETLDGEIYLLARDSELITEDNRFLIITSVSDAYNKGLYYLYINTTGVGNVISFEQNGSNEEVVVQNTLGNGGSGYIYVLPQDMIKANNKIIYSYEEGAEIKTEEVDLLSLNNLYDGEISSTTTWFDYLNENAFFISNAGEKIPYSNIMIRILLVVADGEREETALRLYNTAMLATIKATKHYILMTNLALNDWNPLFAESAFVGSLTGYNPTITISFTGNSGSLFKKIGQTGKVQNLIFNGENSSSFVANENDGLIKDITIDVFKDETLGYKASKIVSSGIVGGIVGTNNGTIDGARVLGADLTGGTVGGIAGINKGMITNCAVEFYKFASGANGFVAVNTVGGIAGTFESENARIENSYVYDYTLAGSEVNLSTSGGRVGAFVGDVANGITGMRISNSFAVVGISNAVDGTNSANVALEDYYLGYYSLDEYQNTLSVDNNDRWVTGENIVDYVNAGYQHLKFYQAKATDLSEVELQASNKRFVKVDENKAILYFYEVDTFNPLTNAQAQALTELNTYDLSLLFGVNSGIVVDSSNQRIVKAGVASLEIVGTGDVTLTVYSKQDFSNSIEIQVKVVHVIKDFISKHNGITVAEYKLQEGKNVAFTLSVAKSVYLNGYNFNIEVDDMQYLAAKVVGNVEGDKNSEIEWKNADPEYLYVKYTIEGQVGVVQSYSKATDDIESVKIKNYLTLVGLGADYNAALMEYFNTTLKVSFFEGTNNIGPYYSLIPLDPSTPAYLNVLLSTDSDTDILKISIIDENGSLLNLKDKDGNIIVSKTIEESGKEFVFYRTVGEDRLDVKVTRGDYDESSKSFLYTIRLSISGDYKSKIAKDESYKIVLNAENDAENELTKYVDLILESQEIQNIDVESYKIGQVVNVNGNIGYTNSNNPVSVLAPGARSILEVVVDPVYSYYEQVRLEYSSTNGEILTLTYLNQVGAYYFNVPSVVYTAGALTINRVDDATSYAFGVYVPSNIEKDCVYTLKVSFWGYQNGEYKLIEESKPYKLYISCLSQPRIQVDGEDFSKLAKGASKPVDVTVVNNQDLESLTIVGNVSGIYLTYNGLEQNDNGTKTYHYTVSALATADGGKFDIKAEVSRVLNGVRETKSMTTSVVLVEFDIDSISVENAKENSNGLQVFTAYENCTISFNFEYNFIPVDYVVNAANASAVEVLKQKRIQFSQVGSHKEEDKYYINYSYENNEFVEIDIKDQLYLVGSNNREQKLNWTRSSINNDIWTYTYYEGTNARFRLTYDETTHKFEVFGNSTSSAVKLRIKTITYVVSAGKNVYWESSHDFAIQVKSFTDDDSPEEISTALDFLNLDPEKGVEGEAKPYILMNDIDLYDYSPFDTTLISSLDGNGHTINIHSFAQDSENSTLRLALFTKVLNGTLIKNVRVNYYDGGKITVDTSANGFNNIQIAGFAIENEGIIYNSEVVAFDENDDGEEHGIIVEYVRGESAYYIDKNSAVDSTVAGFVINNSGNITNSRVGGISVWVLDEFGSSDASYHVQELKLFTIKAQGEVSGFVSTNSKAIASSFVGNVQITNQSTYNGFETAGFVNTNTGKISTSYAEGSNTLEQAHAYCNLSSSIESIGIISGFAIENGLNGYISNCMSNIVISTNSLFGSGFVYKNQGEVIYCYSASQIESASFTQMGFTGLDKNGNLLSNEGKISYSYYYDMDYDTDTNIENSIKTGAELINLSISNNKSNYYGFSFASGEKESEMLENADGIWYMKDDGRISIIPADTISHSVRYIAGQNDTTFYFLYSTLTEEHTYNKIRTDIGTKINPIIIASAQDFDAAMGTSRSDYVKAFYNDKEVFGSYRFVDSINLKDLGVDEKGNVDIVSTKKTLTSKAENGKIVGDGQIDGNGFEISNISIASKANSSAMNSEQSFGLFASLRNGAKVFNLALQIDNVTGDYVYVVGGLAGIVVDSTVVNVSVEQKYNGSELLESSDDGVKAQNIAGGVVGIAVGKSVIKSVSVKNSIVRTTKYDSERGVLGQEEQNFYINGINLNSIRTSLISNSLNLGVLKDLSIAGGVIGFVDIYKSYGSYNFDYETVSTRKFNVSEISATETVNIRGEVVGGLFGYTSPTTYIQNSSLILTVDENNENYYSKILSFNSYAGGIVGLGQGMFYRVYAQYDLESQAKIEDGFGNYYAGSFDSDDFENRGYTNIFYTSFSGGTSYNYSTQAIGGFAGVMTGGAIENSYSKINVVAKAESKTIAGGIIGKIMHAGLNYTYVDEPGTQEDGTSEEEVLYVPTTVLLYEVYASGDVRGGYIFENDITYGYGGGIVGQLDPYTYLSLISVNAVNYYRYDDVPVAEENIGGIDKTVGRLEKVGVRAIVGKNYGQVNIVQPKKYDSDGAQEGRSTKSVGYYSYITNANGDQLLISDCDGSKQYYYIRTFSNPIFEISSISEFADTIGGYNAVSGAFVQGGHWQVVNWVHDESSVYPRIRFISLEKVLYLDRDNVNMVVRRMQNSNLTVYVRGLDHSDGTYGDVDLSGYLISGYYGSLIGPKGWLKEEEIESRTIAVNGDGDFVGIILKGALFTNINDNGFQVSNLTIKYADYYDNNGILETQPFAASSNEGLFISGVPGAPISLKDLEFKLIKCNGKIDSYSGNAGFLVSSVIDSRISNVSLNFDENSEVTVNMKGVEEGDGDIINVGLLAGKIVDESGKTLIYGNRIIKDGGIKDAIVKVKINTAKTSTVANIGAMFGSVFGDNLGTLDINTTAFSYENDRQKVLEVSLGHNLATINLGGQIGIVKNVTSLSSSSGAGKEGIISVVEEETGATAGVMNYGGIAGNLEGVQNAILSGVSNTVLSNTRLVLGVDVNKLVAGGMYGHIGSGDPLSIKATNEVTANAGFTLATTKGDGQTIGEGSRIGGLVGHSETELEIVKVNTKLNIAYYGKEDNESSSGAFKKFKATVGGLIGQNSAAIAVDGAETTGTLDIFNENGTGQVGGLIGLMSNNADITNSLSELNIYSDAQHIGGLVGHVDSEKKLAISKSVYGELGTLQAYGNGKQSIGGLVGFVAVTDTLITISESIFGGLIYANGDSSYKVDNTGNFVTTNNGKSLIVGGIVAEVEEDELKTISGLSLIKNNFAYGDVIVHYGGAFKYLKDYVFGGIVGQNNGATISDNFSMMTNNNDRLAGTSNNVGPIISSVKNLSGSVSGNKYSNALTLCLDKYEPFGSTDVAYNTVYGTRTGHESYDTENTAIELAETYFAKVSSFYKSTATETDPQNINTALGTKLNPFILKDLQTDGNEFGNNFYSSASFNKNGLNAFHSVVYVTTSEDIVLSKKLTAQGIGGGKNYTTAFVGDGFTLEINILTSTEVNNLPPVINSSDDRNESADTVFDEMKQNSFISSTVVKIDATYDIGNETALNQSAGAIANKMSGGIVASCGAYGKLSVGGEKAVYLGGIVGAMESGHILDSYSSVDVTYRANVSGKVAGFANMKANYSYIDNSYSTGKVETYNNVAAYSFTGKIEIEGGSSKAEVNGCYTISPIFANDHTKVGDYNRTAKPFDSSNITYSNCWYDPDATRCSMSTTSGVEKIGEGIYNVANVSTNYGYPVLSNIGYLSRQTTKTVEEGVAPDTVQVTYLLIHNARMLATAISSENNYMLEHDIDLAKTESYTSWTSTGGFSNIVFEGNNRTISGLDKALFESLSSSIVRNLRLTDVNIISQETCGSLANSAGTQNTISDVTVSGNINSSSSNVNKHRYWGGIVGWAAQNTSFDNCKNYVNMKNTHLTDLHMGGIVGWIRATEEDEKQNVISNCVNYAPIQNDATAGCGTGGIVGYVEVGNLEIKDCGNTNSVLAGYVIKTSANYYAGGIAGYSNGKISISGCYNTAMVKAGNKWSTQSAYAAGIIGMAAVGTDGEGIYRTTLSGCLNEGVIEALSSVKDEEKETPDTTKDFDGNKLILTYNSKGIKRVYADAFAGNRAIAYDGETFLVENAGTINVSDCKDYGTTFKNGLYGEMKYTTPNDIEFEIKMTKTDNVDRTWTGTFGQWMVNENEGATTSYWIYSGKLVLRRERNNWPLKKHEYAVFRLGSISETTLYITKTDDLGAPLEYTITLPRYIYYLDTDGTILTQNTQEIYMSGKVLDENQNDVSYYKNGHIYGMTSAIEFIDSMKDKTNSARKIYRTIGGKIYSIAEDAETLYQALSTCSKTQTLYYSDNISGKTIKNLHDAGYTFAAEGTYSISGGSSGTAYYSVSYNETYNRLEIIASYDISNSDVRKTPKFNYTLTASKTATKRYTVNLEKSSVYKEEGKVYICLNNVDFDKEYEGGIKVDSITDYLENGLSYVVTRTKGANTYKYPLLYKDGLFSTKNYNSYTVDGKTYNCDNELSNWIGSTISVDVNQNEKLTEVVSGAGALNDGSNYSKTIDKEKTGVDSSYTFTQNSRLINNINLTSVNSEYQENIGSVTFNEIETYSLASSLANGATTTVTYTDNEKTEGIVYSITYSYTNNTGNTLSEGTSVEYSIDSVSVTSINKTYERAISEIIDINDTSFSQKLGKLTNVKAVYIATSSSDDVELLSTAETGKYTVRIKYNFNRFDYTTTAVIPTTDDPIIIQKGSQNGVSFALLSATPLINVSTTTSGSNKVLKADVTLTQRASNNVVVTYNTTTSKQDETIQQNAFNISDVTNSLKTQYVFGNRTGYSGFTKNAETTSENTTYIIGTLSGMTPSITATYRLYNYTASITNKVTTTLSQTYSSALTSDVTVQACLKTDGTTVLYDGKTASVSVNTGIDYSRVNVERENGTTANLAIGQSKNVNKNIDLNTKVKIFNTEAAYGLQSPSDLYVYITLSNDLFPAGSVIVSESDLSSSNKEDADYICVGELDSLPNDNSGTISIGDPSVDAFVVFEYTAKTETNEGTTGITGYSVLTVKNVIINVLRSSSVTKTENDNKLFVWTKTIDNLNGVDISELGYLYTVSGLLPENDSQENIFTQDGSLYNNTEITLGAEDIDQIYKKSFTLVDKRGNTIDFTDEETYLEVAAQIVDCEYKLTVNYEDFDESKSNIEGDSIEEITESYGIILFGDCQMKDKTKNIGLKTSLSGNGYCISYITAYRPLIASTSNGFIKNLNIAGSIVDCYHNSNPGILANTINNGNELSNISTYGAISTRNQKYYSKVLGIIVLDASRNTHANGIGKTTVDFDGKGISSYVNFSSYCDRYDNEYDDKLINSFNTFKIPTNVTNYGTIIGYDGSDGEDGTEENKTGHDGKDGQTISITGGVVSNGLSGLGGLGYSSKGGYDKMVNDSSSMIPGDRGYSATKKDVDPTNYNSSAAKVANMGVKGWYGVNLRRYSASPTLNNEIEGLTTIYSDGFIKNDGTNQAFNIKLYYGEGQSSEDNTLLLGYSGSKNQDVKTSYAEYNSTIGIYYFGTITHRYSYSRSGALWWAEDHESRVFKDPSTIYFYVIDGIIGVNEMTTPEANEKGLAPGELEHHADNWWKTWYEWQKEFVYTDSVNGLTFKVVLIHHYSMYWATYDYSSTNATYYINGTEIGSTTGTYEDTTTGKSYRYEFISNISSTTSYNWLTDKTTFIDNSSVSVKYVDTSEKKFPDGVDETDFYLGEHPL